MKNRKIFISILLILCLAFCLCACNGGDNGGNNNADGIEFASTIKNVIIIIGDGMGFNHIANTKTQFGVQKFDFEDDLVCPITTYSKNNAITDSAAAGTALATGNKADNGAVGRVNGENVENIMQIARSKNKRTGILTTDYLYGATPACFSSHADNRSDKADIINGQAESGVDLMIGQQHSDDLYLGEYREKFTENGYELAETQDELFAVPKNKKAVACLDSLRSKYNENISGQLDMGAIVDYSLNFLDCEAGFCLMIEHAHIDKCSHSNDLFGAVCEMRAMADTIEKAYAFAEGRNDTAVIITADHETGGLSLANDKSELKNGLYSTGNHTAADVPLFAKNVTISGTFDKLDNTFVFVICKRIMQNR